MQIVLQMEPVLFVDVVLDLLATLSFPVDRSLVPNLHAEQMRIVRLMELVQSANVGPIMREIRSFSATSIHVLRVRVDPMQTAQQLDLGLFVDAVLGMLETRSFPAELSPVPQTPAERMQIVQPQA